MLSEIVRIENRGEGIEGVSSANIYCRRDSNLIVLRFYGQDGIRRGFDASVRKLFYVESNAIEIFICE